jgi:hypothetical protein
MKKQIASLLVFSSLLSCQVSESIKPASNARRIATRSDLIGGNSALGEINDILLENQKIKVVIQDKGYSRGFGVYGGSLIDADIVRATDIGNSNGGRGNDLFGELFPIFFLQALQPEKVEILDEGGPNRSAKVQVTGKGGEFLSLTQVLNRALVNSYQGFEKSLGELIPALKNINLLLEDEPRLNFTVTYTLPPNERYLLIDVGARNVDDQEVKIPSSVANLLFDTFPQFKDLAMKPFRVPVGFVALFGAGNQVFTPGYGYDLRFSLEDHYALATQASNDKAKAIADMNPLKPSEDLSLKLPALPGILSNGLISSSREGVSYGIFYIPENYEEEKDPLAGCTMTDMGVDENKNTEADAMLDDAGKPIYPVNDTPIPSLDLNANWPTEGSFPKSFVYNLLDTPEEGVSARNVYEKIYGKPVKPEDVLIPFSASSFTGILSAQLPQVFGPPCSKTNTFYARHLFVIGDGDVSSVMDTYYAFRKQSVQKVVGRVFDTFALSPVHQASVIFYDEQKKPVNQSFTTRDGAFQLTLPAGKYFARVEKDPTIGEFVAFEVKKGEGTAIDLSYPTPAVINVEVRGEDNLPLPAKVTIVSTFTQDKSSLPLKEWLFDLSAGQRWRTDDLIPNTADDQSRRYIENSGFTENGVVSLQVPPGDQYEIYMSRGTEYELLKTPVSGKIKLTPGQVLDLKGTLRRVVHTDNYVSADFHLHADPSLDSDLPLRDRVISAAGEGLEYLVSTDHNFVTDYQPFIDREHLNRFVSSMIGLELTTLEAGHFNTFPIKRDLNQITRGAFQWSNVPPLQLFEKARSLKQTPESDVIVQVNHPRDLILGYYSQYNLNALTGKVEPPAPSTGGGLNLSGLSDQLIGPKGVAFFDESGNSQFSDQYDAIEILNHGLFHEEFHATMPKNIGNAQIIKDDQPLSPEDVAKIPQGAILCSDDEVAYAGAIDDWFNLLNLGYEYTGTANSDSHHSDDIGFPRTYVRVGQDNPELVRSTQVTSAIRTHQATLSRGPFLEIFVNDQPIGSKLKNTKNIQVKVKIQAPEWVEVTELNLVINGEVVRKLPVVMKDNVFESETLNFDLEKDSWIVAYAKGDRSMFPVAAPVDIPPVLLNEAFGTIAGPLGFGGGPFEEIAPKMIGVFKPFAISNPIWIDTQADGFTAPGVINRVCNNDLLFVQKTEGDAQKGLATPQLTGKQLKKRLQMPSFGGFPRTKGDLRDIRILFENFGTHSH